MRPKRNYSAFARLRQSNVCLISETPNAISFKIAGEVMRAATIPPQFLPLQQCEPMTTFEASEHWTRKSTPDGDLPLYIWRKRVASPAPSRGAILFVHGSSMASTPTFDLQVPGRPDSSVMEWFATRGFDTWCADHEG